MCIISIVGVSFGRESGLGGVVGARSFEMGFAQSLTLVIQILMCLNELIVREDASCQGQPETTIQLVWKYNLVLSHLKNMLYIYVYLRYLNIYVL